MKRAVDGGSPGAGRPGALTAPPSRQVTPASAKVRALDESLSGRPGAVVPVDVPAIDPAPQMTTASADVPPAPEPVAERPASTGDAQRVPLPSAPQLPVTPPVTVIPIARRVDPILIAPAERPTESPAATGLTPTGANVNAQGAGPSGGRSPAPAKRSWGAVALAVVLIIAFAVVVYQLVVKNRG